MQRQRILGLALCIVIGAWCGLSTSGASADPISPLPAIDHDAAVVEALTESLAAFGYGENIYIAEDGALTVRLPSDAPQAALTAAKSSSARVTISRFMQRDFNIFTTRVAQLAADNPSVAFMSMYSPANDELEFYLPDNPSQQLVRDANSVMGDYGIAGTVSFTLTSRD